jgi:hypothetical protein
MEVYVHVYVYSMFVLSCVGRGLAMSWSLVQGVLPTVLDTETEVKWEVSWIPHAPVGGKRELKKNMSIKEATSLPTEPLKASEERDPASWNFLGNRDTIRPTCKTSGFYASRTFPG